MKQKQTKEELLNEVTNKIKYFTYLQNLSADKIIATALNAKHLTSTELNWLSEQINLITINYKPQVTKVITKPQPKKEISFIDELKSLERTEPIPFTLTEKDYVSWQHLIDLIPADAG